MTLCLFVFQCIDLTIKIISPFYYFVCCFFFFLFQNSSVSLKSIIFLRIGYRAEPGRSATAHRTSDWFPTLSGRVSTVGRLSHGDHTSCSRLQGQGHSAAVVKPELPAVRLASPRCPNWTVTHSRCCGLVLFTPGKHGNCQMSSVEFCSTGKCEEKEGREEVESK